MYNLTVLSIIVPTYHRYNHLLECVDSIVRADKPLDPIELIIVDDGGQLPRTIEEQVNMPNTKWVYLQENHGQPFAQSEGVAQACGQILAFLDDDLIIDKEWITSILTYFKLHPEIGAVLGKIEAKNIAHILPRMRQQVYERRHQNYISSGHAERIKAQYHLELQTDSFLSNHVSGGNFAIRRSALQAAGGIVSHVRRGADGILSEMLLQSGYAIGYNPSMIIYHDHNRSYWVMYKNGFGEGKADAQKLYQLGAINRIMLWQACKAFFHVPIKLADFPELLQADKNPLKIYFIYTSFSLIIAIGQLVETICILLANQQKSKLEG